MNERKVLATIHFADESDNIPIYDSIVLKNIMLLAQRSNVGISKYGTTLDENNHDDFLKHTLEELLDAVNYLQKEISTNIRKTELIPVREYFKKV